MQALEYNFRVNCFSSGWAPILQDNIDLQVGRVGVLADREERLTRKTGLKLRFLVERKNMLFNQ